MSVDVRVILLAEYDKTIYIRPYIELETPKARLVCMGMDNVVILSLYQKTTRKQRFKEIEPGSTPFILSPPGK